MRLFVTDLDGTLLNEKLQLDPENERAIRSLKESGIEICFASGRSDGDIVHIANWLGGGIHRISNNGAVVRTKDGRTIANTAFDAALAKEMSRTLYEHEESTILTFDDEGGVYVPCFTERSAPFVERMYVPVTERSTLLADIGEKLLPGKFSAFGEMKKLEALQRTMVRLYGNSIDTYKSDVDCIDFMPRGVDKGKGLAALLAELGLSAEQTACVGDSQNDISMLVMTNNSFAMSHANSDVRASAAASAVSVAEAVDKLLSDQKQPRT